MRSLRRFVADGHELHDPVTGAAIGSLLGAHSEHYDFHRSMLQDVLADGGLVPRSSLAHNSRPFQR